MLRRMEDMRGFTIRATDGEIGHIDDFYFEDDTWQVRYLVIDTGPWLFGRKVLISPHAIQPPLWAEQVLPVTLTKEQVENSPDIDLERPVSRQHEISLHRYYGWPAYWSGAIGPGPMPPAHPMTPPATGAVPAAEQTYVVDEDLDVTDREDDPHLHSLKEVTGYHIQATDGEIGHLEDLFVSEKEWNIHYALVDTRNWLPGRKVLIVPGWIEDIDWAERSIMVGHTRQEIEESPEFDPKQPLDRDYEMTYHDYYGQPYYWI